MASTGRATAHLGLALGVGPSRGTALRIPIVARTNIRGRRNGRLPAKTLWICGDPECQLAPTIEGNSGRDLEGLGDVADEGEPFAVIEELDGPARRLPRLIRGWGPLMRPNR
jgi:hypothetical protein